MPWPLEKSSVTRLKKVSRSRKWLIAVPRRCCALLRGMRRRGNLGRCLKGEPGGPGSWNLLSGLRCECAAAFDGVEQSRLAGVEDPRDPEADRVEGDEAVQRRLRAA